MKPCPNAIDSIGKPPYPRPSRADLEESRRGARRGQRLLGIGDSRQVGTSGHAEYLKRILSRTCRPLENSTNASDTNPRVDVLGAHQRIGCRVPCKVRDAMSGF